MGVHSGEPQLRDGEYWGIDVHYAARLCTAAHGGQVLLSAATRGLVPDSDVDDLGEHALKDFPVARRLFHLVIDGQRSDAFPLPRTLSRSRTNLPSLVTPLVGREVELADLTRRLAESDSRLVTVTGSGGSGKTKLAMAAAGELLERFADGVFLVALAPVPGPAGVVAALVDNVAPDRRLKGEESALFEYLWDREVLLVVDNFEHVLEAAPVIGRLLDHAPKARVLVTSQAPLRLAAETVVPLEPLTVPAPGESDLDRLASVAAVALFVERAQACDSSFSLTAANASSVGELCRSLDGLPLALELAAARVRMAGVGSLLDGLNRNIEFLGQGTRDLPARQRGLRAALNYTVSLLDDRSRRLLFGLGAFADAWTIEDAEKVFGAEMGLWDAMATLLDLSLIRRRGDGRLTMAERVKTHARELLARSGREDELRGRHASLMAEISEMIDIRYWFDSRGSVVRTREYLEELEYAISWSRLHRPDLFRRLLGGCARTFWVIGRLDPLVGDIHRLSEQEDGSDFTSGCILLARGVVERMRVDHSVALPWFVRGVECHRRTADVPRLLASMAAHQIVLMHTRDAQAAQASLDEAFDLTAGQADRRFHDFFEGVVVWVAIDEGEFETAERRLQEILRHPERTDFVSEGALILFADCAFGRGQGQVALERYRLALEQCVADHDVVNSLGEVAGIAASLALLRRDDEAGSLAAATQRLGRDLDLLQDLNVSVPARAELAALIERIGPDVWARCGEAASGLSFDDLVAKARSLSGVDIGRSAP
jgi:predicted ATPase